MPWGDPPAPAASWSATTPRRRSSRRSFPAWPARDVEFSRDGRWIAYVRHPDGTLWRSRRDGTEGRQLTFPPLTAALPRWSPDGRRIAYMSQSPGEPWHSAIVATEGGESRSVGQARWVDPSWSPEGEQAPSRNHVGLDVGASERAPRGRPSHRRGVPRPEVGGPVLPALVARRALDRCPVGARDSTGDSTSSARDGGEISSQAARGSRSRAGRATASGSRS